MFYVVFILGGLGFLSLCILELITPEDNGHGDIDDLFNKQEF